MKENNSLRESLEQMHTQRLDEMLQAELEREPVNGESVRLILSILEERESNYPMESGAEVEAAWEKYQAHMDSREEDAVLKPARKGSQLLKAASIVAVICALFAAMPQKAEAETFFEILVRWTDSVFELFSSTSTNNQHVAYAFETENPGLQEVYDAVTALGVTELVVPMWLPDGYELAECEAMDTPTKTGIIAEFENDGSIIVFKVEVYSAALSREYHKNETEVEQLEMEGVVHNIMQNDGVWAVVWTKDNLACFLNIDCEEEILYKILRSIYSTEE